MGIMKYLFAVNPVSGKGKAKKKMNQLAILLKEIGLDFEIYLTQPYRYADDLKSIIQTKRITHVFAVGGDGTAHEVLNAVMGLNVTFGVIPFGSGNDFARMLRLPKKKHAVLDMIKRNEVKTIDVGQFGSRYFLNYMSFGIDVAIVQSAEKFRRVLGGFSYVIGLFNTLFKYRIREMRVNNFKDKAYLTTIHNGKYFGGGMKINPLAEVNDGVFDFVAVKEISKLKLIFLFPTVFIGKHFNFKKIVHYETNSVFNIEINEKMIAGVDGEFYYFDQPLEVHVVKDALKILI
jgi:diacylglycerol kinase (ATP)